MKKKIEIARICFDGSLTTTILDGDRYYLKDGMFHITIDEHELGDNKIVVGERFVAMVPIDNLHYIREVNP